MHFVTLGEAGEDVNTAELPTILLIEDEDALQLIVEDALSEGGFQIATVKTGEEAVTLLKGGQPYRALVTDVNLLGRLDGWEVARAAREIDPHFPVVYMTGGAADKWPIFGVPNSILLQKPFAPAQVVSAVSQLLNAASQQTGPA
ncbi:response regulator [Bradyrhizobium sp. 134]|uniref:response regulator n=1 Tax=unclassified Bradyrhizobium TaxID=2631580 RepID=UPI001FF96E8A